MKMLREDKVQNEMRTGWNGVLVLLGVYTAGGETVSELKKEQMMSWFYAVYFESSDLMPPSVNNSTGQDHNKTVIFRKLHIFFLFLGVRCHIEVTLSLKRSLKRNLEILCISVDLGKLLILSDASPPPPFFNKVPP